MYQYYEAQKPGGVGQACPWDLVLSAPEEQDSTDVIIEVNPGLIGGILPQNWNIKHRTSSEDTVYGIITVNSDGTNITNAEISFVNQSSLLTTTSPVTVWSLPSQTRIGFGIYAGGLTYRLVTCGNIYLAVGLTVAVPKASVELNQYPLDHYYRFVS